MQFRELSRTTTFRLTLLYGVVFAAGTIALLWMVYMRSAVYLTSRVDTILNTEADALVQSPRPSLASATVQLRLLQRDKTVGQEDIARVAGRIEQVLERFRGILRLAELEVRHRRAGFTKVD